MAMCVESHPLVGPIISNNNAELLARIASNPELVFAHIGSIGLLHAAINNSEAIDILGEAGFQDWDQRDRWNQKSALEKVLEKRNMDGALRILQWVRASAMDGPSRLQLMGIDDGINFALAVDHSPDVVMMLMQMTAEITPGSIGVSVKRRSRTFAWLVKPLKSVGVLLSSVEGTELSSYYWSEDDSESNEIDPEQRLTVRHQIFFSSSLLTTLLFWV